jgi:hypothetical protein
VGYLRVDCTVVSSRIRSLSSARRNPCVRRFGSSHRSFSADFLRPLVIFYLSVRFRSQFWTVSVLKPIHEQDVLENPVNRNSMLLDRRFEYFSCTYICTVRVYMYRSVYTIRADFTGVLQRCLYRKWITSETACVVLRLKYSSFVVLLYKRSWVVTFTSLFSNSLHDFSASYCAITAACVWNSPITASKL